MKCAYCYKISELKYSQSMDKDQEIKGLKGALTTIPQLNHQMQELEACLFKYSCNSHLPPSSDRFARQPRACAKKAGSLKGG